MILAVTPNPALDVTYRLPTFETGRSHRVDPGTVRAGGKGVNVARVLRARGWAPLVLAPVGGASGDRFTADLDDADLAHVLVASPVPTRTTTAVVSDDTTTNLNETGQPQPTAVWAALQREVESRLAGATALVVSGSFPPGTGTDVVTGLVTAARSARVPVVVDTSGDHLLAAADAGATHLKPNRDELHAVAAGADPVPASRSLARRGGALVHTSLGAEGMLGVHASGPLRHARLGRALRGNTTGAGDAAVAALVAGIVTGADDETLLRTATAWSAAAVLAPLAGEITDPEPLLAEVVVTEIKEG